MSRPARGGDCDGNGVLDSCEDCNGNGLADACELETEFEAISPQLSPIGLGSNGVYTFPPMPDRASDVSITIRASADIDSTTQSIAVYLNNTFVANVFNTSQNSGGNCASPPDAQTIVVAQTTFDMILRSANASFRLEALNSLPTACNNQSFAIIEVRFTAVNTADSNGNGTLDLCECDADCAASGPDTLVNVSDLLSLLASWGPGPDACDVAPGGGDGQIDVMDLLALLAAWGTCAQ